MYYLKEHPDRSFVNKLYDGMVNGFDLGIDSPPTSSLMCRNLKSATDISQFVSECVANHFKCLKQKSKCLGLNLFVLKCFRKYERYDL